MKKILPTESCFGCTACKTVCKNQAISIANDKKGFEYPVLDKAKCINCGLCTNVCPKLNDYKDNSIQHVYAAKNMDEIERSKSTSGGIAKAIINEFLNKYPNSKIYGCIIKDKFVCHYGTEKIEELDWFYGSKYVTSKFDGILNEIIDDLKKGKHVLFFGTPCQAAGVRNTVPARFKNYIFLVDVICHGPGSPKLWNEYIDFIEKKENSSIVEYLFRDKRGGWKRYSIFVKLKNGKTLRDTAGLRSWSVMFFKGLLQRSSCFECKFATEYRYSDITIGDFWGIETIDKSMIDEKGVSIVTTNSKEGEELFKALAIEKVLAKEEPYDAIKTQTNLCGGRSKPRDYEDFWMDTEKGFVFLASKYGEYNYKGIMKAYVKRILRFLSLYK